MNSFKVRIGLRLLGLGWGVFNLATAPAAESSTIRQSQNEAHTAVSTQAEDLGFFSSTKSSAEQTVGSYQLVQSDLEKFCQDYPYNSRCSGQPGSVERSPIPVPVPPAPPEGSEEPDADIETQAEESNGQKTGWAIVPEVSTLGLGGHVVKQLTPNFNARVGVNTFKLGIDVEETEFDYEGDLNLFNVSTLIDLHPIKSSGFRISGGLVFNDNNIQGSADVSEQVTEELGEVEIDGTTIDAADLNLGGLITFDNDIELSKSVAPYLGIGGGNAVGEGRGLGFWWNLGVVFSGAPEVEIESNISDAVPAPIREEVEAAADRVLEDEEQDLEDELDFLKVLPVLSLGVSYQF